MDKENPLNNPKEQTPDTPHQSETQDSSQPAQPQPTASLGDRTGPALNNTGVNLESPILGPSHFDNIKTPNLPQHSTPVLKKASSADQKAKTYMIVAIILGALAAIGIIVGIYSLIANMNTEKRLSSTESALKTTTAIIEKVEEETGKTINSPADVPEYNPVTGYIYVTEWGIKFKIPDDLENISYTLDAKYRPQICFTGNKTGIKYFPAFADIDQNPGGLGCVTQVASHEGDSDKDNGMSFGQRVFTYGEYNYFYSAPETHFSQDPAEQGLEDTAVQIIKNMIANNISHYE